MHHSLKIPHPTPVARAMQNLDKRLFRASNARHLKHFLSLSVAAFAIAGCAQPTPPPTTTESQLGDNRPGTVSIISDPPGAEIHVNGRAVGTAPCIAHVPVTFANGKWLLRHNATFLALPHHRDEHGQSITLQEWTGAPKSVQFEMRGKEGPPVQVDLDL